MILSFVAHRRARSQNFISQEVAGVISERRELYKTVFLRAGFW